jgi:cell division protein FtsB
MPPIRRRLRDAATRLLKGTWPLLLASCALLYFGYHAVHGQRGFFAWMDRNRETGEVRQQLAELQATRGELQRRIDGLKEGAGEVDRDLLEGELRKLGYVRPGEVLVLTPEGAAAPN